MAEARLRWLLPLGLSLAVLVPLGVLWQRSLIPGSLSVVDMGVPDFGTDTTGQTQPAALLKE